MFTSARHQSEPYQGRATSDLIETYRIKVPSQPEPGGLYRNSSAKVSKRVPLPFNKIRQSDQKNPQLFNVQSGPPSHQIQLQKLRLDPIWKHFFFTPKPIFVHKPTKSSSCYKIFKPIIVFKRFTHIRAKTHQQCAEKLHISGKNSKSL